MKTTATEKWLSLGIIGTGEQRTEDRPGDSGTSLIGLIKVRISLALQYEGPCSLGHRASVKCD